MGLFGAGVLKKIVSSRGIDDRLTEIGDRIPVNGHEEFAWEDDINSRPTAEKCWVSLRNACGSQDLAAYFNEKFTSVLEIVKAKNSTQSLSVEKISEQLRDQALFRLFGELFIGIFEDDSGIPDLSTSSKDVVEAIYRCMEMQTKKPEVIAPETLEKSLNYLFLYIIRIDQFCSRRPSTSVEGKASKEGASSGTKSAEALFVQFLGCLVGMLSGNAKNGPLVSSRRPSMSSFGAGRQPMRAGGSSTSLGSSSGSSGYGGSRDSLFGKSPRQSSVSILEGRPPFTRTGSVANDVKP